MPRFILQENGSFLDSQSEDSSTLTREELEGLLLSHQNMPKTQKDGSDIPNLSKVNLLIADIQESLGQS